MMAPPMTSITVLTLARDRDYRTRYIGKPIREMNAFPAFLRVVDSALQQQLWGDDSIPAEIQ
jgi:hypothetical protein